MRDRLEYIKNDLQNCKGYAFIDRTLDELANAISQRKAFDFPSFNSYFSSKNVSAMSYPVSFIQKCIIPDVRRGKFDEKITIDKKMITVAIQPLLNAFRKYKIGICKYDDLYITVFEEYLINNNLMSTIDLIEWNHKAIKHLANKGKTTKDFIFLFKNTKDMRAVRPPYQIIEEEFEKERLWFVDFEEKLNAILAKDDDLIEESETENEIIERETNCSL